jgi:eukaryotic-like serine/threonine-protein kinase
MGFLMRRTVLILCVLALTGCSGLRLGAPLRHTDSNITTFAGSNSRNNDRSALPVPPLFLEWEQDITAGIGDGAPCLIDSILFAGNLRGELYAFAINTGRRIGWVTLGGAIQGTPVITGNVAIVPLSGSRESVVAFDYVDGKIRWRSGTGDIHGSPLLLGTFLYVGNTSGTLTCMSLAGGEKIWSYSLPGNMALKGIRSSPAGQDSTVIFCADDGFIYNCNAQTGILRWRVPAGSAIQATPVLYDSCVFVGTLDGRFVSVDLQHGRTRWTATPGGSIYGSAVADPVNVIVGTTGGHVVAMDRITGSIRWDVDLRSPVSAGLLGAGDIVYVGTLKKELLALKRSSGEIIWRTPTNGRIKTTPVGGAGRIFIGLDTRTIQSFREGR